MDRTGVVVIGRNEGERLKACLRSLPDPAAVVYVDSGSTDGSVEFARGLGVTVVTLDTTRGFTAARARNAGLAALTERIGPIDLVQMVDGDCEVDRGWIAAGQAALAADPGLAVVFGRRRERFPEASIYNRMCDEEWDVPVGEAMACGGDALFRVAPLEAVGGYDPGLIAGEEPDLCQRLRAKGWRMRRISAEMTLHDAAMTRFSQYWNRAKRAGHAFAELAWRYGAAGDPHWRTAVRRVLVWGALLPALALSMVVAALSVAPYAALVAVAIALLYPLQIARIALRKRHAGAGFALASATLLTLGKFAELAGLLRFHLNRLAGRDARLIEYKG